MIEQPASPAHSTNAARLAPHDHFPMYPIATSHVIRALVLSLGLSHDHFRSAQQSCPNPGITSPPTIIEGPTLIDAATGEMRLDMSVLIIDGVIAAIGRSGDVKAPAAARRIDGRGRWITAGLIDGHTHERPEWPGWPDDARGNMWMYLSHGITGIMNMGEHSGTLLGLRDSINTGVVAGPRIFAGHFARGPADGGAPAVIAADATTARTIVRQAKLQGYDYLKIYARVPTDAFDALADEARKQGMAITGHATRPATFEHLVTSGLTNVQHAVDVWTRAFGSMQALDSGQMANVTGLLKSNNVVVTPTFLAVEKYARIQDAARAGTDLQLPLSLAPGLEYMHPEAVKIWRKQVAAPPYSVPTDWRPSINTMERMMFRLHTAGIPLIAGSDNIGVAGSVPGFSLHEEFVLLKRMGMTPREVLASATVNPARWLSRAAGRNVGLGVIATGYRADLLLLRENPLTDISALRTIDGVMAGGRWYGAACLQASMDSLRKARRNP